MEEKRWVPNPKKYDPQDDLKMRRFSNINKNSDNKKI
jgi:hypothetical protein